MSDSPRKRLRPPRPESTLDAAKLCLAAALGKKALNPVLLDVAQLSGYTDYFLIISGRSTRQVSAVAEDIRRTMKKAGIKALGSEGMREGTWVLLDFGDVVVHVFHQPVRDFFDLESLWGDAPRVECDPADLPQLDSAAD